MRRISLGVVASGVLLVVSMGSSSAFAAAPSAGYLIESSPKPTVFSAAYDSECQGLFSTEHNSCNSYVVTVTNSGSLPTDGSPITITDTLPTGMTAQLMRGELPQRRLSEGKLFDCSLGSVKIDADGNPVH